MAITSDMTLMRNDKVQGSEVDGEFVLINVTTGEYFGFDAVASEIWRRIETPIRVGELCSGLVAEFEGDSEEIERETFRFLDELVDEDLAKVVIDSPGGA